jgi:hypothetical protein
MTEYNFQNAISEFMLLRSEASEWKTEWNDISDYLIPGRGIYNISSTPSKRRLSSPKAINTSAEDALDVLVSGIAGGLIPSSKPWLVLEWDDPIMNRDRVLKNWLQEASRIFNKQLLRTNFYAGMRVVIEECVAFGTGVVCTLHK